MRVRDLQEFLAKFTENKKDGSSQGNAMRVEALGPWSSNTFPIYHVPWFPDQGACCLWLEA
jgi:hypothetical protein